MSSSSPVDPNTQFCPNTKPPRRAMNSSTQKPQSDPAAEDQNALAVGGQPYLISRRPRAPSGSSSSQPIARTPARSFYHRSFHGQLDQAQYSSGGLREQTAELASLAISDGASSLQGSSLPASTQPFDESHVEIIEEVSEPVTPQGNEHVDAQAASALTNMLHEHINQDEQQVVGDVGNAVDGHPGLVVPGRDGDADESSPLLPHKRHSVTYGDLADLEEQHKRRTHDRPRWYRPVEHVRSCGYILTHPKTWSLKAIYQQAVVRPVGLLPAVFLGLLLNVLDALSYGMILFPLGHPIFDALGSDGIAMFYVSTIIAQVVYSGGGSVFRGGIGSQMIEVVPFFHKMAFTILDKVGEDKPQVVLATTILSYAISSVLTGAVFFLMGALKLGSLIGFFPRHILIGCIGGVGWFLVATGFEVSARLSGNLNYDLPTLKQLFRADTVALWLVPLALALSLLGIQRFVKSNYLVGAYFIAIAVVFYIFKFALHIPMETLHDRGWVFDSPPAGNPWYHFYTLYDFNIVDWPALGETVPAMFALTFFGVLHVPINVPALGISTGEDNLSVNRELVAHGVSNCLSGLIGSVQNYLVYTNSLLFMDSGGNDRLAGLLLAAATFGILVAGPVIIGYIPIMVVGALIFLLGIELLEEALVGTWGKVHRLEYITILIIVVTMGVWDFVIGILVGILLAALSFVVQASRRTAIRASFSGEYANSTVRRPPVQHRYLKEAGRQIFVLKLAGFLFFGTIVGVEKRIRALLAEDAFSTRPLRFLVLDMTSINGIDYSAAEAFTRINRLLEKRGVKLVISGVDIEGEIGQALRNVGLFEDELDVELFPTLNEALEHCENLLLTTLYRLQEHRVARRTTSHLEVPVVRNRDISQFYPGELIMSSPRGNQLARVAESAVGETSSSSSKWQSFQQPLPLLLQIFEEMSTKTEDFWHRVTLYFERLTFLQGTVIFTIGDKSDGFYMLEEGLMKAEYDLPQGRFTELIVAGRPFGELPFFSETPRTATMTAEKDSIAWQLNRDRWQQLQAEDPDVAEELLTISLKLTKERMDAITSYVLVAAA
ncbi:hypothetical protein DV736_g3948, partial [Chaetothyriales sp. CBS 134916]